LQAVTGKSIQQRWSLLFERESVRNHRDKVNRQLTWSVMISERVADQMVNIPALACFTGYELWQQQLGLRDCQLAVY
jgi:hypothetical protein